MERRGAVCGEDEMEGKGGCGRLLGEKRIEQGARM